MWAINASAGWGQPLLSCVYGTRTGILGLSLQGVDEGLSPLDRGLLVLGDGLSLLEVGAYIA